VSAEPEATQRLLALAQSVAREAGALVVAGRSGSVTVAETKSSPTDVVTAVDLASERLIRDRVLSARPDDGFLGEEGDDVVGTSGVRWVADPIDGTVNYLYGLPQYAVSIAAEVAGEVVAGIVHNPVAQESFAAVRGSGATLNGRPIAVSQCTEPREALVATGFGYRADVRTHQAAELTGLLPRVRDIRRLGSAALDLCFLACGRVDAYVERGLKPWDLAAGRLIALEAGARVEGLHGRPAGELLAVAAGPRLFPSFVQLLEEAGFDDWPMPDWP
jgi:myo-inositol-1(or 4)-monophosphatase